ncbi:MAG: hypothetical protein TECD_01063 [Hyphomicrobiaceae bacterium hypho_1]
MLLQCEYNKHFKHFFLALALVIALLSTSKLAIAGLKFCNSTSSRIGVAIGYQGQRGIATEGWWNINAKTCESVLRYLTPHRYIYIYAVDYERGGEWAGNLELCVSEEEFIIRDTTECEKYGYNTVKFYEVVTGNAVNWTIRLRDPPTTKSQTN